MFRYSPHQILDVLGKKEKSLCFAESCTAGTLCSLFASFPGASAVVRGGVVTYCDAAKMDLLRVDPYTLGRKTAVSPEIGREMAEKALDLFKADFSVSTTGYLGPFTISTPEAERRAFVTVAQRLSFLQEELIFEPGSDRLENRGTVVTAALTLLSTVLQAASST